MKPSEVEAGDVLYRYENTMVSIGVDEFDESLGSRMELYCYEFEVERATPKGCKIFAPCGPERNWGVRSVMDATVNKFAYPTKADALRGFIARKKRQQAILNRQFNRSQDAQQLAERALAKKGLKP